jgi:hypothetical protein
MGTGYLDKRRRKERTLLTTGKEFYTISIRFICFIYVFQWKSIHPPGVQQSCPPPSHGDLLSLPFLSLHSKSGCPLAAKMTTETQQGRRKMTTEYKEDFMSNDDRLRNPVSRMTTA